ncbi:NTP transferase domain-containing protein [Aestuariivirga sp.]|uniref:phosphocholine cytidylyltransferase family protein n=1 Tax=Aestuariivirga sp. TaxID=2650926 RepID=UPI0039E6D726
MRVIILAAGQGKRLLPLTAEVPKALLDIGGRSLIGRQIDAFAACGLKDFVVVTGYNANRMDEALAVIARQRGVNIGTVYNPFYAVADNLASCWMARGEMTSDFIQVNGDNVFRADLVEKLLKGPDVPVAVAVNLKDSYDPDDMKVMLDGGRLTEIGKTLPVDTVDAEAIGFYVFKREGVSAYVRILEKAMREPSGLKQWFPAAIGMLAKTMDIATIPVTGTRWGEVDFPVDLQQARQLAASWG